MAIDSCISSSVLEGINNNIQHLYSAFFQWIQSAINMFIVSILNPYYTFAEVNPS